VSQDFPLTEQRAIEQKKEKGKKRKKEEEGKDK